MEGSTGRTLVLVGLLLMCVIIAESSPIFHESGLGEEIPEEPLQGPSGIELQNGGSEVPRTASQVIESSNAAKLDVRDIPTNGEYVHHVDNDGMPSEEQLSSEGSSLVEIEEKPSEITLAGMHLSEDEIIRNVIVGKPNANGSVGVQSYTQDFSNLKVVNGVEPLRKDDNVAATPEGEYFEKQSSENSPATISLIDTNTSERKFSTNDDERIVFNTPECQNHTALEYKHSCDEEQRIVKKSQALDQARNIDESELVIENLPEDTPSEANNVETYSPNKVVIPIPRSDDSNVGADDIGIHETIIDKMKPDASTIIIITSPNEEISVKHFVLPGHSIKDEYYVKRENNSIFLEKLKQGIEPAYNANGLEEQLVQTSFYMYQKHLGNFTEDTIRTNNTVTLPEKKQSLQSTPDATVWPKYTTANNSDSFVSVSENINTGTEIVSPTVSQNENISSPADTDSENNKSDTISSINQLNNITSSPAELESNAGEMPTELESNAGEIQSRINPQNDINYFLQPNQKATRVKQFLYTK